MNWSLPDKRPIASAAAAISTNAITVAAVALVVLAAAARGAVLYP